MNNENIVSIYNRTYNNCKFYNQQGKNKQLLNEIGALRGIVYCLSEIIGENNINNIIDFPAFVEMIHKQIELLAAEEKEK